MLESFIMLLLVLAGTFAMIALGIAAILAGVAILMIARKLCRNDSVLS